MRIKRLVGWMFLGGLVLCWGWEPWTAWAQRADIFKEITDEEIDSDLQRKKAEEKTGQTAKTKKEGKTKKESKAKKEGKTKREASSRKSSSRKSSASRSSKSRKKENAKEAEDDGLTFAEREKKRQEHFQKTGVWLWPELSEDDLEALQEEQSSFIQHICDQFPTTPLRTYESDHFYFVSDCPASIARECNRFLETAYAQLCRIFSLETDDQVWRGKCPVIAFCRKADYQAYEQSGSSAGRCHAVSNGDVYITSFFDDVSTMDNRWRFIGVLVHEMTHGFVHRYKARGMPPLWLNEGVAEFVSSNVVKADKQVPLKMRAGLQLMKSTNSLGGILQKETDISVAQYGIACGLVTYLTKLKPAGVGLMIEQLKEGKTWEVALEDIYGLSMEKLLFGFGRVNGIPNLQP